MIRLYRILSAILAPAIRLYLVRRRARGKEPVDRFSERLGQSSTPRPPGALVWLHGASVGEALSMLPLIGRLQENRPDLSILVTTGTVTSADILRDRLPDGAIHQFIPADLPDGVRRFLDHWRPDSVLWFESDLWPNMLSEIARRKIGAALVNGRMSDRSIANWRRAPRTARQLLACFRVLLGQSPGDTDNLTELSGRTAGCIGNLKTAASPLPADPDALAALRADLGDRRCILAASTHAGEERMMGEIHTALQKDLADLLTVVVPRHADRGRAIAAELTEAGLAVARRSEGETLTATTDILLADTMGELGLFYRVCPIVVIGKSFRAKGGQNPIEPVKLGCAVVTGPEMSNFRDTMYSLTAAQAAVQAADEAALQAVLHGWLTDPDTLSAQQTRARNFGRKTGDILPRLMDRLEPILPEPRS